jgi:non-specific serine/threonine protein kinase
MSRGDEIVSQRDRQARVSRVNGNATLRLLDNSAQAKAGDDAGKAEFTHELREVLAHLYDPIYLQKHALTRLVSRHSGIPTTSLGTALRQLIVDAIEALRPFASPEMATPVAASYEILRLRYVEGLDRAEIQSRLALGRSEYFREQRRGIDALASLIQDRQQENLIDSGENASVTSASLSVSPAAPPARQHNLPAPMTSYIARAGELGAVADRLRRSRLLTLTGAGGCGKTRLALEVARAVVNGYPDGAWLVELAPLAVADLVPDVVAATLEVRGAPGQPILPTLLSALRSRRILLILDNCEHLLDACARLADAILRGCPHVQVLATSREALGITGEVSWLVPSLSLPPLDRQIPVAAIAESEAIRLFVDRAAAVQPALTLTEQNASTVTQICRRLDGIPLAIELAARRVKTLALEHIAARLDQRFRLLTVGSRTALPRQQTLAATVDWSYDLLTEPERTLFDRLSVFSGAFSLEAVEAVCSETSEVLDVLSNLASKSLVIAESGPDGVESYRLLETLRQYGRDRLILDEEAEALQRRHASYYLQLAEVAKPHIVGSEQLTYLARVNLEWDNVRAAMHWYLGHGAVEEGLRLAAALEFSIWYRGLDSTEGHVWRTRLLGMPGEVTPSATRTNALIWAGTVASNVGDIAGARHWLGRALAMANEVGDDRLIGWAMHRTSRFGGPDPEQWYGATQWELADGALRHYRRANDRWGIAIALAWLGNLAFHGGASVQARELLAESLATARSIGERHCLGFSLRYFGETISTEDEAEARALLVEGSRHYRELRDLQGPAYIEYLLGRLDALHGRYVAAREHFRTALPQFRDWTWLEMIVRSLNGLALVAPGRGQPERAFRLAAASARWRDAASVVASPVEQAELERALALARQDLSEAEIGAAQAKGAAMSLDETIAFALDGE